MSKQQTALQELIKDIDEEIADDSWTAQEQAIFKVVKIMARNKLKMEREQIEEAFKNGKKLHPAHRGFSENDYFTQTYEQ